MVTLNEAEQLLDRLSNKSVAIQPAHCVCVRNRHATCTACMDVCPTHALHIEKNQLNYNPDSCIDCGSCANVCPTQALHTTALPLMPYAQMLHEHITEQDEHRDMWVCCQKHPLANDNLEHLIVVPCLTHLDEAHYLLAAYYRIDLHVLHPDCTNCQNSTAGVVFENTYNSALKLANQNNLNFSCQNHCENTRSDTQYPLNHDRGGYSRRGFFSNMGNSLKHLGFTIADTALESNFSRPQKQPTLAEALTVAPGVLETFIPKRITLLLNILYDVQNRSIENNNADLQQNKDATDIFSTRLWGKVSIDETCRACGMCARFCPTGALSYKGEEPKPGILFSADSSKLAPKGPDHEFRCSDCIQCRLCEDICPAKALHVDSHISIADLLNLEPTIIKRHDTV